MAHAGHVSGSIGNDNGDSYDSDDDPEAQKASRKLAGVQEAALVEQADKRSDAGNRGILEGDNDKTGRRYSKYSTVYLCLSVYQKGWGKHGLIIDLPLTLRLLGPEDRDDALSSLQSCEVWIGSSESNGSDSSRLDDLDEDALLERDGIGIVYIPLAANDDEVPGFDPFSVSTWRRELTMEESQALLDVSAVCSLADDQW